MILGVGTDLVKIDRFEGWKDFSQKQLLRVFSEHELAVCRCEGGSYNFSSLAARFAAKEAFFKALSATLVKLDKTKYEFSFLFFCSHVQVVKTTWDVPVFEIDWVGIVKKVDPEGEMGVGFLSGLSIDLSLSHEKAYAIAVVIISKS